MTTGNSVVVLECLPLSELFQLYDDVRSELEKVGRTRKDDENE